MEHAAHVVDMLERYSSDEATKRYSDAKTNLGIWTSKTKGRSDLARAIAAFTVDRHVGIVSVPDLYCEFNRARGVDLVSPDDFVDALDELPPFLELKIFSSGNKILRPKTLQAQCTKIFLDALTSQGSLTPLHAADLLHVSAALAKDLLIDAEASGLLCRDVTPLGGGLLTFFPNRFPDYLSSSS